MSLYEVWGREYGQRTKVFRFEVVLHGGAGTGEAEEEGQLEINLLSTFGFPYAVEGLGMDVNGCGAGQWWERAADMRVFFLYEPDPDAMRSEMSAEELMDPVCKGTSDGDEAAGSQLEWRDPKVLELHRGGEGLVSFCASGRFVYYDLGEIGGEGEPFHVYVGDYSVECSDCN